MTISCYLVDDEYHSLEILKAYVDKTPGLVLAGLATDPLVALSELSSECAPMLSFLDVDMPELSGMELAGMVSLYTRVIFTTSYPEYAVQAFEKDATDYLLKPISYARFLNAVGKVKKQLMEKGLGEPEPRSYFYIKSDVKGKMLKIMISSILYVEAAQNYVSIHCGSQKFMAYLTMEEVMDALPKDRFIRVHRSFIVSQEHIKSLEYGQVTLDDNTTITLGRYYKDQLLAAMKQSLVQSKRSGA